MKICEICKSRKLKKVLDLGSHPLCDDLIKINSQKKNKLYPIKIILCLNCLTAFNQKIIKKKILFPENYHYRSRLTNDVLYGMKDLVNSCENYFSLNKKVVLDIGCNDGSLLDLFKKKNCTTIGVEPTNAARDIKKIHNKVYNSYFTKNIATDIKKKFPIIDIITFTNVFAHIEDIESLLKNLNILISPETLVVIENHYLGSILKINQFDTFYHEHLRTYSLKSFIYVAKKIRCSINNFFFPKRYGGNIRVVLSKNNNLLISKRINKVINFEESFINKFGSMKKNITRWKKNKKKLIKKLFLKYGKIPGKAFPGRAAIIMRLLNLDTDKISKIYEKNSSPKIGYLVPGTKIPICSDDELFKSKDSYKVIINFAWHISKEIKLYLLSNNVNAKIIDIIEKKDFKII